MSTNDSHILVDIIYIYIYTRIVSIFQMISLFMINADELFCYLTITIHQLYLLVYQSMDRHYFTYLLKIGVFHGGL